MDDETKTPEGEDFEEVDDLLGIDDELEEDLDLEGLGRRYGMSQRLKKGVKRYGNRKARKAMVKRNITKGQASLTAKVKTLDTDTRKKWKEGTLQFDDGVFFVRKDITDASGIVEVFTDALDKATGITNISKGKLPEFVNLALERVELRYDVLATANQALTVFDYLPLAETDDPALMNGELEMLVEGKPIFKILVNKFLEPDKKVVGSPACGFNFKAVKHIREARDIQFRIHFAGTMTNAGTDTHAIEITLKGDATKPR